MKMVVAVLIAIALVGCAPVAQITQPSESTGNQSVTPKPEVDNYAALVVERFGDCLAALKATPPVATDDGAMVIATIEGVILQWTVSTGKTGDVLTWPADPETAMALQTVGC